MLFSIVGFTLAHTYTELENVKYWLWILVEISILNILTFPDKHYGKCSSSRNPTDNVSSSYNLSHSTTSKVTITWICKLFTTHIHCAHCTNVFLVPNLRKNVSVTYQIRADDKTALKKTRTIRLIKNTEVVVVWSGGIKVRITNK